MPVLGVCGDSFMAATPNLPRHECIDSEGKHFTEILAKTIQYDYFTLARGACSNTAIRLQIDEMINRGVDFVILNSTTPNRIEFPVKGTFDSTLGVYNINYEDYPDTSSMNPNFKHGRIVSETLTNIIGKYGHPINKEPYMIGKKLSDDKLIAIKHYIQELHDDNLRSFQDTAILSDGLSRLIHNQIPFLYLGDLIISEYLSKYFEIRIIRENKKIIPNRYVTPTNRRWHNTDEDQVTIFNHVHEHIKQYNLLNWNTNE